MTMKTLTKGFLQATIFQLPSGEWQYQVRRWKSPFGWPKQAVCEGTRPTEDACLEAADFAFDRLSASSTKRVLEGLQQSLRRTLLEAR
jgi:hypothetical protein